MSQDQVSFGVRRGVGCLRLEGELRHPLAEVIDDFSASLFDDELRPLCHLVLDLGQATFMDSTVIGLLVALARECRSHRLPPPTLICSHPELLTMLQAMRLEHVFRLIAPTTDDSIALTCPARDNSDRQSDELRQTQLILKAHLALIAADESNREAFGSVVELLQGEVLRLQSEHELAR